MSELAVQGCSFKASITTGSISPTSITASSSASTDVLVNNKGVYFDKVTVTIASGTSVTIATPPAGASSPTGTLAVPDTIDITGTADNVLDSNGNKAVQKGDNGSKSIQFMFPPISSPNPIPYEVTVKVEISDAGQSDVIAS